MAKGLSGWLFIGVGFLVMSVSIFFYDTLRFFIFLGGLMTIYGLGKLTFEKVKSQMHVEFEGPVDLDKTPNPYVEQHASRKRRTKHPSKQQQQRHVQHHPQQGHKGQRTHPAHQYQHRQPQAQYCPYCGMHAHSNHRFCSSCGGQLR